ncbi:MAG: 16S rRNA (cytosine(1402)-N(4))-methyltransferase RsmH [Proteobacteria bacterium]|nr:16S rRNA (cytosine(1402)-N(4))-methyltransferase RsmH [Pseudomonadota bacterium]
MTDAVGKAGSGANEMRHIPVLGPEAVAALGVTANGIYVDGTFGAGGYTRAILATEGARVIAIDRDPNAVRDGQGLVREAAGRLTLVHGRFGDLDSILDEAGIAAIDGVVLDIGVSSMQIDEAIRGFSFRHDGPLDMRMAQEGESAADLVNGADEAELADIFYHFGEERLSRLIARAIVTDRKAKPFTTTRQLADMIGRIIRTRPGDIHPATRTFQALRIAVNDELGELVRALHAAERVLKPDGTLSVVSFHSLEDRIVKMFFAARSGRGGGSRHSPVPVTGEATFRIVGKWPVTASAAEVAANPRARSAKLRAAVRTNSPARAIEAQVAQLSTVPLRKKGRR